MSHLGAAVAQIAESDDKIIMDHVRQAYKLIVAEFRAQRGIRAKVSQATDQYPWGPDVFTMDEYLRNNSE